MKLPPAIRTVVFWTHLTLGVSVGLVIFVMSVTGAVLGFKSQILQWAYGPQRVASASDSVRLPLDTLLARASIRSGDVESVVLKADARMGVMVRFRDRAHMPVILDPFTASSLALPQSGRVRSFLDGAVRWHVLFVTESERIHRLGTFVAGASNLLLVLVIPLGLLLWWPASWTMATLRATVLFKRGLGGRARDFNWHNVTGLWCSLPLFLITLSGVFMSYQWPGRWLDRTLGSPSEKAAAMTAMRGVAMSEGAAVAPASVAGTPVAVASASPGVFYAAVSRDHPGWRSMTIEMPSARQANVQVGLAEGNTFRPDLKWTMLFDAVTAAPIKVSGYATMSVGRRLRSWYRFTHTGEAFGVVGQVIATLTCVFAALLVWTGLSLSWRRFIRWRGPRSAQPAQSS